MTRKGRALFSVKLGMKSNGKMEAQTVPGETWGQESPPHGRGHKYSRRAIALP